MTSKRTVMKGCPPTIFITVEESDRFWTDVDLMAEIEEQAKELVAQSGGGVQVCTVSGYMPAAYVDGKFV